LGPTQPPIQWVPAILTPGAERPGREAGHLPPSGTEVKNAWRYTSTLQYVFMEWCLVKHKENFTFTLILIHYNLLLLHVSWMGRPCSDSELNSETTKPSQHFGRAPWSGVQPIARPPSTRGRTENNVHIITSRGIPIHVSSIRVAHCHTHVYSTATGTSTLQPVDYKALLCENNFNAV